MYKLAVLLLTLIANSVAAIEVPTDDLSKWTTLSFRKIPANTVSIDRGALQVVVDGSASPLIYGFDAPVRITGVQIVASWDGELRIPDGAVQGNKETDDFVLKFGLVEAGDQTLSWLQRKIAADWVKQLFMLAPSGAGVRRIHFLSTTQQADLVGSRRSHPLNDLLFESRITLLDGPGRFELAQDFAEPVETLGLWVSSDGDTTSSKFVLRIESITLKVAQ